MFAVVLFLSLVNVTVASTEYGYEYIVLWVVLLISILVITVGCIIFWAWYYNQTAEEVIIPPQPVIHTLPVQTYSYVGYQTTSPYPPPTAEVMVQSAPEISGPPPVWNIPSPSASGINGLPPSLDFPPPPEPGISPSPSSVSGRPPETDLPSPSAKSHALVFSGPDTDESASLSTGPVQRSSCSLLTPSTRHGSHSKHRSSSRKRKRKRKRKHKDKN